MWGLEIKPERSARATNALVLFLTVVLTLQPFFFLKAESCTAGKISQWVRAFFSTNLRT